MRAAQPVKEARASGIEGHHVPVVRGTRGLRALRNVRSVQGPADWPGTYSQYAEGFRGVCGGSGWCPRSVRDGRRASHYQACGCPWADQRPSAGRLARVAWVAESVADPAPMLSFASFSASLSRRACACGFPNVVGFPRDGAFVFVWEYLFPSRWMLARSPSRPARFLVAAGRGVRRTCDGPTDGFSFKDAGRVFQVEVYLGPAVGSELRRQAAEMFDSLRVAPGCRGHDLERFRRIDLARAQRTCRAATDILACGCGVFGGAGRHDGSRGGGDLTVGWVQPARPPA